jgi:hypothetical protein
MGHNFSPLTAVGVNCEGRPKQNSTPAGINFCQQRIRACEESWVIWKNASTARRFVNTKNFGP